jgi:hypothetical protein
MRYDVSLIAHRTHDGCWAAALAMIVSWSDPTRIYSPYDINAQVPNKTLFKNGASMK